MQIDLTDYQFDLPNRLIAQKPSSERGFSRLLVAGRTKGQATLSFFSKLDEFLPKNALLVVNNAQVTPARLLGKRKGKNGRVEVLILDPPIASEIGPLDLWCLAKPGKTLVPQTELAFDKDDVSLKAIVLQAEPSSPRRLIRFFFDDHILNVLDRLGHIPLPPYIKRPDDSEDFNRYQTVYAQNPGAIAAPTAGLHFTKEHLDRLINDGYGLAAVNLRVGAGTFAPLTQKQLRDGVLHQEYVEVPSRTVEAVVKAKREGRSVIAVGTTTARALEWASMNGRLETKSGFCELFIKPEFVFKTIEGLITNFHLPGSSLMMLVAAFMGRENLLAAYERAIEEKFYFFSYGDAMLII
jgi:S-adenosylmethionine:tRNA ribosyltransferase-isomerase